MLPRGQKSHMTRFARSLEPNINCEYEDVADCCFVVRVDFDKKESYDLFIEKYWRE
jgi:hypothetical protein